MVDKIDGWHEGTVNIDIGGGKYDTLTRTLSDKGVHQVSKAIKPDGVAYFTIYEGNRLRR